MGRMFLLFCLFLFAFPCCWGAESLVPVAVPENVSGQPNASAGLTDEVLKKRIEAFKLRLADIEKRGVGIKNYLNLLAPIETESSEPAEKRIQSLERLEKAVDRQLIESYEEKCRRGEMNLKFTKPDGKPDFELYKETVQYRIKRFWSPPKRNLSWSLLVKFKIDNNGRIYDIQIPQPNADKEINDCGRLSIEKASPLPPPPPFYVKGKRANLDFEFTFQYNVRGLQKPGARP